MPQDVLERTATNEPAQGKKRAYISQSEIPNCSLEDALRVPRAIIDNYGGKGATPLQVASALNMTPTSGTFRGLCGAAIAYGLTAGGYNSQEISLEPISIRIFGPLHEGEDVAAKSEAALKPRILREFIQKYENSPLPRNDIAVNVLVDMGVPRERAESVYDLILKTARSVGFITEIKGKQYIHLSGRPAVNACEQTIEETEEDSVDEILSPRGQAHSVTKQDCGQGIFVAHGKNKKPLEQLKRILDQFKIPFKVAIDEPNLGRPIGTKVKEIMQSCNCAILIFTADEEFFDSEGNQVWRPSENVVYELGASGYLYGTRIVILKEEGVQFPSNFRDLGYITFDKDQLEAKSIDVLKELIGFGIVKIST